MPLEVLNCLIVIAFRSRVWAEGSHLGEPSVLNGREELGAGGSHSGSPLTPDPLIWAGNGLDQHMLFSVFCLTEHFTFWLLVLAFFAIGILVNVALPTFSCSYVWILIQFHGAECAGGQGEWWVLPGNIQPDTVREKEEKKMMSVWSVEKEL